MAWQNSTALAGNGVATGGNGEGGSQTSQPQGTEYTLQGVMRFLQTEWHRHERDRNAWEIERAEMRSRIGKLEGDGRTSKRMQETLGKHVKILENALRKEREKVKKLQSGSQGEEAKPDAGASKESPKAVVKGLSSKDTTSGPDVDHDGSITNELRQDMERDKSRLYLGKCVQEVTYHVIPTTLVQQQIASEQEQILHDQQFGHQQVPQHALEDDYAMSYHARAKQLANHVNMPLQPSVPNHQPPPVPRVPEPGPLPRPSQYSDQAAYMARSLPEAQSVALDTPATSIDTQGSARTSYEFPSDTEEQAEKISHSYNAYGQLIPSRDEETTVRVSRENEITQSDGWNFEDPPDSASEEAPPPEYEPPSRPDTDAFPPAHEISLKSPPRGGPGSHRRKSSVSKRRPSDGSHELRELSLQQGSGSTRGEGSIFKVKFALRGHLDVVRSVIFTGGGTPSEPEICTTGDDGVIKRWIIPASYVSFGSSSKDLDISSYFTHRGHTGAVMCLAASPASQHFLNGGRALGDGWVFSGGQDATVRVWERGRVDPKATLDGHTDAVWTVCVLPGSAASVLGDQSARHGGAERALLASGAADGTILIWAVSSPPSTATGSRRGAGGSRRANSISSGSNFPSSPQATTAGLTPFHYSLVHRIERLDHPSPTCISPLSISGDTFVVSYTDASVLIYDTRTAEEVVGMASLETYDGTPATGVNTVAASTAGLDSGRGAEASRTMPEDEVHGATGSSSSGGVEGIILSGHEDRYIRFFDANSGQCTYSMLAHPSAISSLSLSPDGRELVSGGHDASLRFWSLEKRTCTQEFTSHRIMRGEGVCAVVWSADGRWVISGGGDGVVKVFAR